MLERASESRPQLRILAPDLFWWRVPVLWRYVPANVDGDETFDWVVVHKGEMQGVPRRFLEAVMATMRPVLANEVFVVFTGDDEVPAIDPRSAHFLAFVDRLARTAAQPTSHHPAIDDRVFGAAPTLRRFASMEVADARHAQDEFFADGGYTYPTRRDQVYHRELLRHRDRLLAQSAGCRVLELCAGAFAAGPIPAGTSLVRSDFSTIGLEHARSRDGGIDGIVYLVCDANALALADASFDVVLFVDAIEHVFDAETVVREAGRVLRPGGAFLVTFANRNSLNQLLTRALGHPEFVTNHQHIREFTLIEVTAMLSEAGLAVDATAGIELRPFLGVPGVDPLVRDVVDDDEEFVDAMRVLGERAGAEYAYVGVVQAQKRP
jgi:SAM-dependent methyltransferase